METSRKWLGWAAAAVVTLAILGLTFAPAVVGPGPGHLIRAAFSTVCHQLPSRSPHVGGVQLAVCHRCVGIYAALAAAPFLYLVLRRWDRILHRHAGSLILASVTIPGVDWAADVAGMWVNTPWSRSLTGAVFGLVAGYLVTRAAIELAAAPSRSGAPHDPGGGGERDDEQPEPRIGPDRLHGLG